MTDLTTLERVKRYCKLAQEYTDDDQQLKDLLSSVSEEVRQYCRQDFDLALFEETYNGSGNRWIILSQYPVREIKSLYVNGNLIENGYKQGYILNERGLCNPYSWWPCGFGNVSVSYIAGFDKVPEDIQQAVVYVCSLRYKKREHLGLSSRANGTGNDSYDPLDLPDYVKQILDKYIEPDLVIPSTSKKTSPPPSN